MSTDKIVLEGVLEDPEREEGGSVLAYYGCFCTEDFGQDGIPGIKLDVVSYHPTNDEPDHSAVKALEGKKLRITIEVLP